MPKLDTTIDNLELKSNKVTGTVPSASWTDAQYPSAKTLYNAYNNILNMLHPVGSIMTTAAKVNPAETVGGTWELVDKDAKDRWMQIPTTAWTPGAADINTYESNLSYVSLSQHTVHFRMFFSTTADLTDTEIVLGKLDVAACGLVGIPYGILGEVAASDGGACTICWKLTTEGTLSVVDVLNVDGTHLVPSGQTFYLNFTYFAKSAELLDDFCDKFYWKRTA